MNPAKGELDAYVRDHTDGNGFDVVYEASGSRAGILTCTDVCKIRGTIVPMSLSGAPVEFVLGKVSFKEMSVVGSRVYPFDHFKKGVVAMARSSNPDSATSTFFITLGSSDNVSYSLDRQYAAFGTIDRAGMKVVDQIVKNCAEADTDAMGGIANKDDMPIIKSITVK